MKSFNRKISAMMAFPLDTNLKIFCPQGLFSAKNSAIRRAVFQTFCKQMQIIVSIKKKRRVTSRNQNKSMAESSKTEKKLEPCRACHDFKSWSKLRKKEIDNTKVSTFYIFSYLIK